MNDLLSTNGKTWHCRDLGLPKTKNINTVWPTPQQIKLNATKRETVPVAFRIDEVAYTMLNLFAEQCDLTTSAFVNELINSYINQNEHNVDGAVFKSAINLSVDRIASKIKKMSAEQAIFDFHKENLQYVIEELLHDRFSKEVCKPETIRELLDAGQYMYMSSSFLRCFVSATTNDNPTLGDYRKETPEVQNSVCFEDFALDIPYKKWVFIKPILVQFSTKCEQFLTQNEYDKLSHDEQLYKDIADIINKFNDRELIDRLVERIKFKSSGWTKILQK